jgi:hypothetical protein
MKGSIIFDRCGINRFWLWFGFWLRVFVRLSLIVLGLALL